MKEALSDRIKALDDASAFSALTILAERHQMLVDVESGRVVEQRIADALTQPDLQDHIGQASGRPARAAAARLILVHLADSSVAMANEVDQALTVAPADQRFEPITLGLLGAMVLYAFSSEITLEKKPDAGWSFRFHHTPLKESTTGKLLGELFKLWRPG